MRNHIGLWHVEGYDQAQRTRLAFYIACRSEGIGNTFASLDNHLAAVIGGEQ